MENIHFSFVIAVLTTNIFIATKYIHPIKFLYTSTLNYLMFFITLVGLELTISANILVLR